MMREVKNLRFSLLLILLILVIFPCPAWAEQVLTDSFTDTSRVDLTKTTATIDLVEHCVRLPQRSLVNALALQEDSTGYAVATSTGIKMYDYDDATHTINENNAFSSPWAIDATGVSLRQDNLNIWAISESSLAYYKFNGSSMSDDPSLKLSGLRDVLSVAAYKNSDSALILQRDNGTAKITKYTESFNSLVPETVFQTSIIDPIAISIVNDSPDFVLSSKDSLYYFMYDDFAGNYIEDTAKRLALSQIVVSTSSDDSGTVVSTTTDASYYMNDDAGPPKVASVYSVGAINKPVSISLRNGQYEYAYLDEDGKINYYIYDEAAQQMVRDSSMETTGHTMNKGYAHPREYYSKVTSSSKPYDAVMLTVSQSIPANTSINWYVSSNGGTSWVPCYPGAWTAVVAGSQFAVKAILDTTDTGVTPKILAVTLTAEDDIQVIGTINPSPVERGRNLEISAEIIRLTSNETISVDSVEVTVPTENVAPGHSPTTGHLTFNSGDGKWHYTFLVPEIIQSGYWPDNGSYHARLVARKGTVQKEVILSFQVQGHILRRLVVRTTSW